MTHEQILEMVQEKWGEYLETLPEQEKQHTVAKILCNTIISMQQQITYLERVKCFRS